MIWMVLLVTYFVTAAELAKFVICILVTLVNASVRRLFRIFWGLALRATVEALLFACGFGRCPQSLLPLLYLFQLLRLWYAFQGGLRSSARIKMQKKIPSLIQQDPQIRAI